MVKPQFGRSWVTLGVFLGAIGVMATACSKAEDSGNNGDATGGTGSGKTSTNSAKGSSTSTATGGKTSSGSAAGGNTSSSTSTAATGNVPACQGIPTTADAIGNQSDGACNGQSLESEAIPTDMVILMDKSISNSYAIGTDTATSATPGTLTRWAVLTAGMEALATSPDAAKIGASITFFAVDGNEATQCDYKNYVTPVVAFDTLDVTGPLIVEKMKGLSPSGLTPTVPALQGALTYAMQLKAADPTREKVVVLMSDGFPTICDKQLPSDVSAVIAQAAAADIPIRTFVVGIGSPKKLSSGDFNLKNYARSGRTGAPILIDETAAADNVKDQIVTALLNISNDPLECSYPLEAPAGQTINPDKMTLTFQPASGGLQELPRVAGLSGCSKSTNGGFYFDNPTNPTKVTVCPCNCAAFGAGTVSLVYGCKPVLVIE